MNHKLVNARVSIECSYTTKPGVKVAYEKTVFYSKTKEARKSLEHCSRDLEVNTDIGLDIKKFEIKISNAIKYSWSKTHSFATQTDSEELSLTEKRVEYYDKETILSRIYSFCLCCRRTSN